MLQHKELMSINLKIQDFRFTGDKTWVYRLKIQVFQRFHAKFPISMITSINQVFQYRICGYTAQFQFTVFSRFCYVLLCNHECFHCLYHIDRLKNYITRRNKTESKL